MKKISLFVILTSLIAASTFGLDERGSAIIYTTEGKRIEADEIFVNFGKKWNVALEINGERIRSNIDINSIQKIEIYKWDTEEEWWMEGKIILKESSAEIPDAAISGSTASSDTISTSLSKSTLDGSKEYMILANPDSLFQRDEDYVVYRKKDPVNQELVKNRIWCNSISYIEFGADIGQWKVDSEGNKFSPDYLYNPYTGEELHFGN